MRKLRIYPFVFALIMLFQAGVVSAQEKTVRYILIEAPTKAGFPAAPAGKEKVIITKVFKVVYESSFDLVSAEPALVSRFEVALEKAYPGSRNQVKDVLVFMLNTEKEARELYNRKLHHFKLLETPPVELKIP